MKLKYGLVMTLLLILFSFSFVSIGQETELVCDDNLDFLVYAEDLLTEGAYEDALIGFSCALEQNPLNLDAHRGLIEVLLLTGAYSDAMLAYAAIKVQVIPSISDAMQQILDYYETSLESQPDNIHLLTGYSFAEWYNFNPETAMLHLEHILELEPNNLYGLVVRGNNHFFMNEQEAGEADFASALELVPESADVYFMMADGYLYGLGNLELALEAVSRAAELGLDTPRTDAIFATCYFYLGEIDRSLPYYASHIQRTTLETIEGESLNSGQEMTIYIMPGQSYLIPVEASTDETLIITVSSAILDTGEMGVYNEVDSIMLLLDPDGEIVTGNDDNEGLNAGFEYSVSEAGTYTLLLGTFEGAGLGEIVLSRQ
jgi:tetratricopeptide (TPR) repeat protein